MPISATCTEERNSIPSDFQEIRFALEPVPPAEQLGKLWRLLENGGCHSFFVSWTWIGTWLRCLPEFVHPHLLTASRAGEIIAAALMVPRRDRRWLLMNVRQLHFNSTGVPDIDCITIEHNGFAGNPAANLELWPVFLRWFAREAAAGEFDELVVPGVVLDLEGDARSDAQLLCRTETAPSFSSVLASGGLDAILDNLSSNARRQLRRSLRQCEALGELRCEVAGSVEEGLNWFGELKTLHIESWTRRGRPHAFRYPFFEMFHRALIEKGVPEGSVSLLRLSAGKHILGYLHNFRWGGCVFAYQSGFSASMSGLRPGYVSHVLAMRASADAGAQIYDFLAGDNRLKRSFASETYQMRALRFDKPERALRLESAVRFWMRSMRPPG